MQSFSIHKSFAMLHCHVFISCLESKFSKSVWMKKLAYILDSLRVCTFSEISGENIPLNLASQPVITCSGYQLSQENQYWIYIKKFWGALKISKTPISLKLQIYLKTAKEVSNKPIFCFLEASRTQAGMCLQCSRVPHWIQSVQTVWQKHDLWPESEQVGPPNLPHTLLPAGFYPSPLPL